MGMYGDERQFFHPRVKAWFREMGFRRIVREPHIGYKIPDYVVKYRRNCAIVECKTLCNESGLRRAIVQAKGYENELTRQLESHDNWRYDPVAEYRGYSILSCVAIEVLSDISIVDAFSMCAEGGVLFLNPGYYKVKGYSRLTFFDWNVVPLKGAVFYERWMTISRNVWQTTPIR